jgi:hypothetical protein
MTFTTSGITTWAPRLVSQRYRAWWYLRLVEIPGVVCAWCAPRLVSQRPTVESYECRTCRYRTSRVAVNLGRARYRSLALGAADHWLLDGHRSELASDPRRKTYTSSSGLPRQDPGRLYTRARHTGCRLLDATVECPKGRNSGCLAALSSFHRTSQGSKITF